MMSIFALLLGGCLISLSQNSSYIDVFVWITIILFSAGFFFDIQKSPILKRYIVPLSAGYLFRISLLVYDVYTSDPLGLPLVGGPLVVDHLLFYEAAIGFSQGITTNYGGLFPRFLGFIFAITGASRLWTEFIVLIFSILTIIVFIRIVDKLDIPLSYRRKGAYLICLLPNYAFLSVVIRRETIITFFVAVSIRYFIDWIRGRDGNKAFVLAFVFALGASLFHGATGLIAISYIFVRIIYSPTKRKYILEAKNIIGAMAFFALFLFVYARFGTVFFGKIESRLSAGVLASTRDAGGSSYAQYVGDARTPIRMLVFAIPRFLYFMFSPFPWQWRGIGDIITFLLSSCVYLYIILNSIRYIRRTVKAEENRNIIIALLIVALLSAVVFSWGVTNTGTATRHRDKFIVIYSVLFSLSQSTRLRFRLSKN